MSTKRIIWIDIVKGCLLVFICCSHFGALPQSIALLTKPTATYWVPLFFFLSGYLFHGNNNFSEYIQKKVRTLLLPYIAFSLIFIIIDWNTYISSVPQIKANLYSIFVAGTGSEKAPPLWFVIVRSLYYVRTRYQTAFNVACFTFCHHLHMHWAICKSFHRHVLPQTIYIYNHSYISPHSRAYWTFLY